MAEVPMTAPQRTSVVRSVLLTVAMRWTDRLIGILSMLILARLLVPADFGIVAMASLVIAFADVLFELGVHVALIQNKNATQAHYDTAWTIRLIQTSLATLVVIAIAPWAADYFNDARVAPVIQVMALSFVLTGLENIGVISFQKNMQFGKDFRFLFSKRLAGFIATIVAAWLLQSYWAMVIGSLAGRGVGIVQSYTMHPMRPRPSLEKFREIFGISQWMLIRGIGLYFQGRLHQIVVGGREDAGVMGAYSLAGQISGIPTTELLTPLNRVLFPAFVNVKTDLVELKRVFLLAQGVQTLIAMPAAIGMALVADELVEVLLGEKWRSAVPYIQVFALMGFLKAITTSGSYILLTFGKARLMAVTSWFQVGVFAALAFLVFPEAGALGIAWVRLAVVGVGFITFVGLLLQQFEPLRLRDMLASIARPVAGVLVMSACVMGIGQALDLQGPLLLTAKILVGALSYALAVAGLWRLRGRPAGAEAYLLGKLKGLRGRAP
jgi:O-antigen/teichoic acid export membrane protein